MHKAQRGQKLSVVRKVVTPLNFLTPPSFSVTPPSCKPDCAQAPEQMYAYDHEPLILLILLASSYR